MPKSKKSRTSDKYIDSLISELKAQGDESSLDESPETIDVEALNSEDSTTDQLPPAGLRMDDSPLPSAQYREDSVTVPLGEREGGRSESRSISGLQDDPYASSDRTQPMAQNPNGPMHEASVKISYGSSRPSGRHPTSSAGQMSEGQLAQAENLKFAQARILELETEMEKFRQENELLAAAGSIAKQRLDELTEKLHQAERLKNDGLEQAALEMKILRESQMDRDRELTKAKKKIEELESRLQTDMKKIRVRERELENRLELARMEKNALVRAKDDSILDLKRKMDQTLADLEAYKQKAADLQERIDQQQDQLSRTVRALRLALTNLESSDPTSGQLVPIKKAE